MDKSNLLPCLEKLIDVITGATVIDAKVIGGSVVTIMLSPGARQTYLDYAQEGFTPYVMTLFQHASHFNIVWDVYIPNSL